MKILKFGGSSISTPENIDKVKNLIYNQPENCVVVISAFEGVTDELFQISTIAAQKNRAYLQRLKKLEDLHYEIIEGIIDYRKKETASCEIIGLLKKLSDMLKAVHLLGDLSEKVQDYIVSFGERISYVILNKYLEKAVTHDVREIVVTNANYGKAVINYEETNINIKKYIKSNEKVNLVSGYVARAKNGLTTTLGRGGSDLTAAVFAAALDASSLEIWTDVDGFMTADPKMVNKAFAIESLSYAEAMELSHFGAEVLYTPTIKPVLKKNIPVRIKNTMDPDKQGTLISNKGKETNTNIKGISSINNVDLITLHGAGLVGVTGISMRLFGALARNNINIILITQASSEASISFAINPQKTNEAIKAINDEFELEISKSNEIKVAIENNLSIIAIVGEKMKNTPGISANLFSSLGRNGINIVAIAQGSSELNISVVIKNRFLKKALNVIHEGFFLSHIKELHLFMVGVGTVGGSLIKQIEQQNESLTSNYGLRINITGIARSKMMLVDEQGISTTGYLEELNKRGEPTNLKLYVEKIKNLNLRNGIFVDCTADESVASLYKDVLSSFASIVTANKIACSSDYSTYNNLKTIAKNNGVKMYYETNVGAGLPIIGTINDLRMSGDKIIRMEAILSGTLNYIFNILSENTPLSKAILLAKEKGFSEPDPRVDLSGIDVVRKLLILCREAGWKMEQKDIKIEKFLPETCFQGTLDEFWEQVKKLDSSFEEKRKKMVAKNKKWRFVASFNLGKAGVSLKEVDDKHPAYQLEGSNNIIQLFTKRYDTEPMVIKGYGAGAEVTAAGVFADIIRVSNI